MQSNWKDGILLVILLFFGLLLIGIDLIATRRSKKKKKSKNILIWDDAGCWFDARKYLQYCQDVTLSGATGVIISTEEESTDV